MTVTGVDDGVQDGSVTTDVTLSIDQALTTDDAYNGVGARVLSVVTQDDEGTSIVGVDFEALDAPNNSPTNWTAITSSFSSNNLNLINEMGDATSFDLSISVTGAANNC